MKNKNFWTNMALSKNLGGVDLKIIMLCFDGSKTQKELCELLNTKKPNISSHVVELLTRESTGIYQYKTNSDWQTHNYYNIGGFLLEAKANWGHTGIAGGFIVP